MTRRRLLLILVFLLVIGAGLSVPYRSWRGRTRLEAARTALAARQFDRARADLETYLKDRPNSAEANLLLARTFRRAGQFDDAEVRLDVCDLLRADAEAVALERVLIAVQQGDLSLEKELWAQVRGGHAEAALILEALARGYRKNYLLQPMLDALRAWLEREPGCVEALLLRGWVHEQNKDYPYAVEEYRRAVAADPGHEEARVRLAQGLVLLGNLTEAVSLFKDLRQRRPADPRVGLGLAQCWRHLGRGREARQLLEELAAKHPGEFPLLLELGQLLTEEGEAAAGESWLRKALARSPHDYQAHHSLAVSLRQQGKYEEARKILARVKEIEADLVAMVKLTDGLQNRPADPGLRCEIGKLFLRSGEEQEGVLWLQSALRIDPGHKPTHRALAEYYEKSQRPSLASRHRQLAR